MKLWRKVGSGFKSNILILITVALWHKVTQSADALAHLISFMSWRIWISQDTRVKQKVISASFAYLNLVESKLNCQNRDYLPLGILLRVLMTIVGTLENSSTEFSIEAQLGQKPLIRRISRGENWREVWIRHCRRFPQHEHFSRSRPLHSFYVFSRLKSC